MRPHLLKTYRSQVMDYLMRVHGKTEAEADAISLEICKKFYKPLTAVIVETKEDGCPVIKAVDLASYFDANADNIMSPSGSIYVQHTKKFSHTIKMVVTRLAERKKHKNLMLKYKALCNFIEEMKNFYMQTIIKINVNSLPGNYGSPYSIFYSKGNYNAITSCGRAMIGYANAEIEAVLGGNFAFFSETELIQHIVAHTKHGIDGSKVKAAMEKYKLAPASRAQLLDFYKECVTRYVKVNDWTRVQTLLDKLSDDEVNFFWYYQNLRHVLIGNENIFRPYIDEIFDINRVQKIPEAKPDDLFKLNGALVTLCNVAFHAHVDPGDPELQVYDLPSKRPELAVKFVEICTYVSNKLKELDDLFNVFIFTPINRPNVQFRKMMRRNSTVISDTDSVIFTVKDWVEWYTGNVFSIDDKAYNIACLMIYWISVAMTQALRIYSEAHGAHGKFAEVMAMKNEFLYPSMILAHVKKHYAGVVKVQEGVILPKPETDIKGVQFKGSDICKDATQFANKYITHSCLDQIYKHGRISGHGLISEIVDFENKIRADILEGKTDWYESLAVKEKDSYAAPMSSPWYYFHAWEEIFADKYGHIQIPNKLPAVPISKPSAGYLEELRSKSPDIYKKFVKFLENNPRCPSKFVINPVNGLVPQELIPIIRTSDIVYHSVKPCHLILKQINAYIGFESESLLFRDVYNLQQGQKE